MCLIFLALKSHPAYKLVLAGNRDEFYNRRTAPADFWNDFPAVLAGRDLEAMGTWLGITRYGRLATLTNYRDPKNINAAAPSRGKLVSDYLISTADPADYISAVAKGGRVYNGFNLLVGNLEELWYYSNYGSDPVNLREGVYGLSNHLIDTPWPKVMRGKKKFADCLSLAEPDPQELFQLLYDEEVAEDHLLPDTGLGIERERALSSMFIKTNGYGSRCSTVIMVDYNDNVFFSERVYDTESFAFQTNTFTFEVLRD